MKDRFGGFDEQERELLTRAIDTEFRRKEKVFTELGSDFVGLTRSDIGLDLLERMWLEIRGEL